jgi:hypothetical protein
MKTPFKNGGRFFLLKFTQRGAIITGMVSKDRRFFQELAAEFDQE